MDAGHSLVRIAKDNQAQGKMAQARYHVILEASQELSVTVLLRSIKGQCLLEVHPGRSQRATKEQGKPHAVVGHTVEEVIVRALRQPQEILGPL
jgi:hypothetical protein